VTSRFAGFAATTKRPVEVIGHPGDEAIRFSFREIDLGGRWSICDLKTPHTARLLKKMRALEASTPKQLIDNHTMSRVNMADRGVDRRARHRLAQEYDGLDVLHEIRVAPSEDLRLHGRLDGRFFNIIWWDANHEIFPEGKHPR
jgi:hypothetical protein